MFNIHKLCIVCLAYRTQEIFDGWTMQVKAIGEEKFGECPTIRQIHQLFYLPNFSVYGVWCCVFVNNNSNDNHPVDFVNDTQVLYSMKFWMNLIELFWKQSFKFWCLNLILQLNQLIWHGVNWTYTVEVKLLSLRLSAQVILKD